MVSCYCFCLSSSRYEPAGRNMALNNGAFCPRHRLPHLGYVACPACRLPLPAHRPPRRTPRASLLCLPAVQPTPSRHLPPHLRHHYHTYSRACPSAGPHHTSTHLPPVYAVRLPHFACAARLPPALLPTRAVPLLQTARVLPALPFMPHLAPPTHAPHLPYCPTTPLLPAHIHTLPPPYLPHYHMPQHTHTPCPCLTTTRLPLPAAHCLLLTRTTTPHPTCLPHVPLPAITPPYITSHPACLDILQHTCPLPLPPHSGCVVGEPAPGRGGFQHGLDGTFAFPCSYHSCPFMLASHYSLLPSHTLLPASCHASYLGQPF